MKRYLMRTLWIGILVVLAGAVWTVAAGAETSGTCGNDLTWILDDQGILRISGNGRMSYYQEEYPAPWGTEIREVIVEYGVKSISSYAFYNCSELARVSIADSVARIENSSFSKCVSLTEISIPDSVTSIEGTAFSECSSLKTVTLSANLTSIGNYAFHNCINLLEINIPDRVSSIGTDAFRGCRALENVTLPNAMTTIKTGTFYNCSSLLTVSIPDSVSTIEYSAFSYCSSLSSIIIPDSVVSIGFGAFSYCSNLKNVVLPEGLMSIENYTFQFCENLESITIPNRVTSIGDGAFFECSSLEEIIIPSGVTSIGKSAFSECSKLKSVEIPDSVTNIGNNAFNWCKSLESVNLPNNIHEINEFTFRSCKGLKKLELPEGLITIGKYAFAECDNLLQISIPDSVTSIGEHAFYSCYGLTSIAIPANVTSIGDSAFQYCGYITRIYIASMSTTFGNNLFGTLYSGCVFYCYEYSDADTWSTERGFRNKVYLDSLDIDTIRTIKIDPIDDIAIGQSEYIDLYIFPDSCNTDITWRSTDPSVLDVVDGTITGIGVGSASLFVTVGGTSESADVYVYMPAQSFKLDRSEAWVLAKDSIQLLPVDILPTGSETRITWSSSDNAFATVDSKGLVKTNKPGEVTITATDKTGIEKTCKVYICYPVTAIDLECETLTVESFSTCEIIATVTTQNDTYINHLVSFTSDDDTIATIDQNGIVTGRSPGTTTITVSSASGISKTCQVIVKNNGTCGSDLAWTLDDNGQLTISGTGSMNDYSAMGIGPWGCNIQTITIESGITEISAKAFNGCKTLTSAAIPVTVTAIGDECFPGQSETLYVQCSSFAHGWAKSNGYANKQDNPELKYGYMCLGHKNLDTAAPVAPTCTETGLIGGSVCLDCGETVDMGEIVPALGHDWTSPLYEWDLDHRSITATHVCSRDEEHTESETVAISGETAKEATCEENGITRYTSGVFANPSFTVQTMERDDIAPLGHEWTYPVSSELQADGISVIASCPCARDSSHRLTETAQITIELLKAPTENEKGSSKITYTFQNEIFSGYSIWGENVPALRDMSVIKLPATLLSIPDEAFEGTDFEAIIIPEGCRSIGARAFANCLNLIYIKIPASVRSIAEDAFVNSYQVRIDKGN